MALRLAIITDIHHGRDTGNVRGPQALAVLEQFVQAAHGAEPDAVLELGDRLTDEDPQTDRTRLLEVARIFKRLPYPRFHLLGNHDLLPLIAQEAILEARLDDHSAVIGGWKLIFLNTFDGTTGGRVTAETLAWLEAELSGNALPVAVFSHQPLHGQWLEGNPYFERDYRDGACPVGSDALRAILARYGVRVCINGHAHWNDLRVVNGIPYVTLLSATESYWSRPDPSRAWALVTLGERITVIVHGAHPEHYEF
jgi:3',5'-cyclic AMP phosphodiesterase CpdA